MKHEQASPNRPSKLSTIAPKEARLPAGFGEQPKRSTLEETSNVRKAASAAHNGAAGPRPNPDYSMAKEQKLNSAGAREVKAMSDVPTVSHALSGSLKITDRKIGRR